MTTPFECGDEGRRCWQCADCKAEQTYWRAQYDAATERERNPRRYANEMADAGRGYLLTADERELVRR